MPIITLIGEKIATNDTEFTYFGPTNECKDCKLKNVCFNLKIGRRYRITNVRDKRHPCNVHEGNVAVVEVEELPIVTSINKSYSEGYKGKIEKNNCNSIGCVNYEICSISLQKDKTYTVAKVIEDLECPFGYELRKVELRE